MTTTLGVMVARLQVADLHAGHQHLIDTILRENDHALILIGDRTKVAGPRNPLPFSIRKWMVEERYRDRITVQRLPDKPSDIDWSQGLDDLIQQLFPEHQTTLYCSRDGFADYYSGIHPISVIDAYPAPSGTSQRTQILRDLETGKDLGINFRRGMIAAAMSRLPIVFSTVDVAVMNHDRTALWLGQKAEDQGKWRFVGGFVDPTDPSRVAAAIREATEELGSIKLDNPTYVGSRLVDDFRYRDEPDAIMTDLFILTHVWGTAVASDDLDAIGWFSIDGLLELLIPAHQELGQMLIDFLTPKGN